MMLQKIRTCCLVLFIGVSVVVRAQPFASHTVSVLPSQQPTSEFNAEEYVRCLHKRYDSLIPNKTTLDNFIATELEDKNYYVNSDYPYRDWPETEAYLKKILAKLTPPGSGLPELRPIVVRDPEINAQAFEDGTIYVNVGLLSIVGSEAELAAVLAHEVGHILKKHHYIRFLERIRDHNVRKKVQESFFTSANPEKSADKMFKEFRREERQSDSAAISLFKMAGYSPIGLEGIYRKFMADETKYRHSKEYHSSFFYYSTHPTSNERIKAIKDAYPQKNDKVGKNYLVDSIYFGQLKSRAQDECVVLQFENFHFEDCIELSFKKHLAAPKDEFYLFYLLESIRRLLTIEPDLTEKTFITGYYTFIERSDNGDFSQPVVITSKLKRTKYLASLRQTIFYHYKGFILKTDSAEYEQLKQKNRLLRNDTLEFISYQDAFDYLSREAADCKICGLTEKFRTSSNLGSLPDTSGLSALEKRYYSLPFKVYEFKFFNNFDQMPVYVNHISVKNNNGGEYDKLDIDSDDKIYRQFYDYCKTIAENSTWKNTIRPFFPMDFNDFASTKIYFKNCLKSAKWDYAGAAKKIKFKMGGMFSSAPHEFSPDTLIGTAPILEIMPEIVNLYYKYKIKKLAFVDIDVRTSQIPGGGTWTFAVYFLDIANDKIYKLKEFNSDNTTDPNLSYRYIVELLKMGYKL